MKKIISGIILTVMCVWIIAVTITTYPLELEYKWQAWAIVTWVPVIVVAGMWEVVNRVCGGRGE